MAQLYKTIVRNYIGETIRQVYANIAKIKMLEISKLPAMKGNEYRNDFRIAQGCFSVKKINSGKVTPSLSSCAMHTVPWKAISICWNIMASTVVWIKDCTAINAVWD